ncbi:hypothetical protein [Methanosarcina barkeri]|uniref:hypothetical protein n=1 Tax=Methanosarcina barkeri TaxID=2208 RepID=UPI0012D3AFA3|nr:hypothetical protein [Methanosarcina barkeri]
MRIERVAIVLCLQLLFHEEVITVLESTQKLCDWRGEIYAEGTEDVYRDQITYFI